MKKFLPVLILSILVIGNLNAQSVQLTKKTVVQFGSVLQGQKILSKKDDYISRQSPFDRSARMKTDQAVSEAEFLAFVPQKVQAWEKDEVQKFLGVIHTVAKLIEPYKLVLPDSIFVIKTNGEEEGGAAYTRQNAIVFPTKYMADNDLQLQRTFLHELFHIFSRHNPTTKNLLYQVIGFEKCNEIEFPESLKNIKLTNPDAPFNDHYIRLHYADTELMAVPILLSKSPKYDTEKGGEFFNYLQFKFLVVENTDDVFRYKSINEQAVILEFSQVSNFFEQVGKNTQYIIHPEEILADNFAMMALGDSTITSPEIITNIKAVLLPKPEFRDNSTR